MSGLVCDTITGELTAAGIVMHGPGWCVLDCTPLWGQVNVTGGNRRLSRTHGDRPLPRYRTTTEHSLGMMICGETDQDGDPYPNPWLGLELNLKYLRDNLVDPPGTATGTRASTLLMPSGDLRTADVTYLDVRLGDPLTGHNGLNGNVTAAFNASLEISIAAGRFD